MGFLTTITFYNDAYDQFEKHPEETIKNILAAMDGMSENKFHYGVGNHANPMKPQKPRHADDSTIYIHHGNTVVDMSPYSDETIFRLKHNKKFYKELMNIMENNLKKLKKLYKEHEE